MQFKPYKKSDGTEELRFVPESRRECDETDCEKCFFEQEHNPDIDTSEVDEFLDSLPENDIDILYSELFEKMNRKSGRINFPDRLSPNKFSFTEMLEMLGVPLKNIDDMFDVERHVEVRTFAIKDGKVITDPETREIMNQLGLIDKIERDFRDND